MKSTQSSNAFVTQKGNVNRLLGMKWSILLLETRKEEFQPNKLRLNKILKNMKIKVCKKIVKDFQKKKIQKILRSNKSNKKKDKDKFKSI